MTTCLETRTLIACRPLDALEEDELVALDSHLDGCSACRVRATELEAAYRLLEPAGDKPFLPEHLWSEVAARLDDPEDEASGVAASGAELPIALVCTFCHDALIRTDARYCASCLAPHHADCFRAHGRCSTPGCEETYTVRPQLEVLEGGKPNGKPRRRRWKRFVFPAIGVLIGGGIAAVAVNEAYETEQFARYRARQARNQLDLLRAGMPEPTALREFHALRRRMYLGARIEPEKNGLRVLEVRSGLGKRAGLRKGDLIVRVNSRRAYNLRELQRRLRRARSYATLLVRRPGVRKRQRIHLSLPRRVGDRPPQHHMRAEVRTFKARAGLLVRQAEVELEVDHDGDLRERRFQVWKGVGLTGVKPVRAGYVRLQERRRDAAGWDLAPRWTATFVQSSILPRPAILQRQAALWLKGPIATGPSAATVLIAQLRDGKSHEPNNKHLIDQLEAIGRAAIDPLCEALRDGTTKAPGYTAWALASVLRLTGSREPLSLQLLRRAKQSESEYVSGLARRGLDLLAAQDQAEGRHPTAEKTRKTGK